MGRKHKEGFKKGEEEYCDHYDGHIPHHLHPCSPQEQEGREGYNGGSYRGQYRRCHLHGSIHGRMHGGFAPFKMEIDIFGDYNTVIHQDPDYQDHPKERLQVDGYPHKTGSDKHGQEAKGNPERDP